MMKKVLITGGAGFIGSHLVERLVQQEREVIVLDNLSTGQLSNLANIQQQINFIEGDILDHIILNKILPDVEKIFHLAAFVSAPLSVEQPEECFRLNIDGTRGLLETARKYNVEHVVIASSAAVYGDNNNLPLAETEPTASLSPYAATKAIKEILADLYTSTYQLPVTALRFFNVFGPRQSPTSQYAAAVPIFIRKLLDGQQPVIYGDGGQTRDLVFINDVIDAILLASETEYSAGQAFNVCTGLEVSIYDLVMELIAQIQPGMQPKYEAPRAGDIYRSVGNPAKAKNVLGFSADTSLADGLKTTIEWMQNAE